MGLSTKRFVRPEAIKAPEGSKPKELVIKEGDTVNVTLPSGTKLQLVATKDNTCLTHGERQTLFHEQYVEGEPRCTWPPMPEEMNQVMQSLFGDAGDDDLDSPEDIAKRDMALAGD